jgi:hypothetical protein
MAVLRTGLRQRFAPRAGVALAAAPEMGGCRWRIDTCAVEQPATELAAIAGVVAVTLGGHGYGRGHLRRRSDAPAIAPPLKAMCPCYE